MGHLATPIGTARAASPAAATKPAGRILVVEDDPAVQKALRRLFETEGYAVETQSDGRSALDSFQASAPAAVVLDLRLPKVSGRDVCKGIKAQFPKTWSFQGKGQRVDLAWRDDYIAFSGQQSDHVSVDDAELVFVAIPAGAPSRLLRERVRCGLGTTRSPRRSPSSATATRASCFASRRFSPDLFVARWQASWASRCWRSRQPHART